MERNGPDTSTREPFSVVASDGHKSEPRITRITRMKTETSADDAFVFQLALVTEVHEQAEAKSRRLQVVMNLGTMFVRQFGDRLDFDDYRAEAEEVGVVVLFQGPPLVGEFKVGLRLEGDAPQFQFDL